MHAYETPFEGKLRLAGIEEHFLGEYRRRARAEAQARMTSLCERAGLPPGATACVLVHGAPAQQILELEDNEDCDLIVAGRQGASTRGRIALGSVFMGSVAQGVVSISTVLVLLVK